MVETPVGHITRVSTAISGADRWEHVRCRSSAFRENYIVRPGLYAVGEPGRESDVLASANYKLSFDALRQELEGLDVWLLVLDTNGINVWCAAGKGTFGTDELVRRIRSSGLEDVVGHRRVIVPQLGAPGVCAHKVKDATGFKVSFGPVRAADIPAYILAGHKATSQMRTVTFGIMDRVVLTPMELNPAMKKFPVYALIVLVIFGLQPTGILFRDAADSGWPFLLLGLVAIFAGAFVTPVLLPFVPSRSFAIKGWIVGMLATFAVLRMFGPMDTVLAATSYLFFPLVSSYIALQFTGSATFTGMTGVEKELRLGLPVYMVSVFVSVLALAVFKLEQWGVL